MGWEWHSLPVAFQEGLPGAFQSCLATKSPHIVFSITRGSTGLPPCGSLQPLLPLCPQLCVQTGCAEGGTNLDPCTSGTVP